MQRTVNRNLDVRQRRLPLVTARQAYPGTEAEIKQSLVDLTKRLVSVPSQSGIDDQSNVIDALGTWLESRGVSSEVIVTSRRRRNQSCLGLLAVVGSGRAPFLLLTACADTAIVGSRDAWDFDPFSARVDQDGWLYGRGSADSKSGLSIFAHLIAEFAFRNLNGTLVLLADSDEHSGRFGAIKEIVTNRFREKLVGAYIGYPGISKVGIGSRGFYRTRITLTGRSEHSGARFRNTEDANERGILLCNQILWQRERVESLADRFGSRPRVTITQVHGGTSSYSTTSDRCVVRVDFRLTTGFQKKDAKAFLRDVVSKVPNLEGNCKIEDYQSWPAYSIPTSSELISALDAGAATAGLSPLARHVSGPSNVGNYLASVGIDAICGFGLEHEGVHAANEKANTSDFGVVYRTYREAILQILGPL